MPPSKAGHIKAAAKKRLARRMSERLMAITASQLVGDTPTPPPHLCADFFFWASVLDLAGITGYLIADFGRGFLDPVPAWSAFLWILLGQVFLAESLCFCLSWRQADYAVGFWPHIFTEYLNIVACSLYAVTSILYIYEPRGDDAALRAIYSVMFIECFAAIAFSADAWMYGYCWCVDNAYLLDLYDENEKRAEMSAARERKAVAAAAAEAAVLVLEGGAPTLPLTPPPTPGGGAGEGTAFLANDGASATAALRAASGSAGSSRAAATAAAAAKPPRVARGAALGAFVVGAMSYLVRWWFTYFVPRVWYGQPDPALPLHPMAPIILPCKCKGKLCGQPLKQRCRYVRLCFYQCYNTEMQEHVWNVIPSIIYIVWASSVIWVQFNVFQNEVFLPAKPRSKAFIAIAATDCYPNLAYDAGGYPPCNNQLLFNTSANMSGVPCFAAVDYTSPPCDAAVWSLGDIGPGPGWNASSPRPTGVNASQVVAGVECFRLVPYPEGNVCADTTLWAPFHINATNCTYKNSKAETREPFAEQQPPCNDPLLWSGLRDGTAAAIADTADPKQAPLPLYKARAVAWVAVGYMYGDILFFFDAILVLYAWRDYYNQRARDYKAGRVTTLQHGGPAHEAHDPTSKPPAAGEAPPLPPHAQLALELPAKDGWLEAANPLAAAARAAEAVSAAGAVSTSSMTATMRTPAPTPLGVAAAGLGADAPGLHADRAQRAERISQLRAGAPSDTDALTPLAPPPGLRVGAVPGATQQALNPMNASAGRLEIEVTRASPGFGGAAEADLSQRRTGITGVVTRLVNAGASKVKLLRPSS